MIEMGVAYAVNESDPMAVVDRKPVVRCKGLSLKKLENNLLIFERGIGLPVISSFREARNIEEELYNEPSRKFSPALGQRRDFVRFCRNNKSRSLPTVV